jgi:hypothetical protein
MPENIITDSTDPGTCWPKAKLLKTKSDRFDPIKLSDFYTEIHLPDYVSADDPIALFTIYYPPEIIEYIVRITNLNPRDPKNLELPYARAKD